MSTVVAFFYSPLMRDGIVYDVWSLRLTTYKMLALNSSTFLWPIWLFLLADMVFSCGRCGRGRYDLWPIWYSSVLRLSHGNSDCSWSASVSYFIVKLWLPVMWYPPSLFLFSMLLSLTRCSATWWVILTPSIHGGLEKTTTSSPHHVAQHRPTGSETTPPYASRSSRFGS